MSNNVIIELSKLDFAKLIILLEDHAEMYNGLGPNSEIKIDKIYDMINKIEDSAERNA